MPDFIFKTDCPITIIGFLALIILVDISCLLLTISLIALVLLSKIVYG